jgi:hypothetical protein
MTVMELVRLFAYFGFDWERFISAMGVPCAILAALGLFFWRAWSEFAPVVKEWLQSQVENDKVHRRTVVQLTEVYKELTDRIDRLLAVAERVIESNGKSHTK